MDKRLAIIGAGGHGKVIGEIALLNNYKTIHFFDDKKISIDSYPFTVFGTIDELNDHFQEYDDFFVAIGDNRKRFEKIEWLKENKANIISLVHPKSTISKLSSVGTGSCVMANAVINPGTIIKNGVIINTSSSIDHDCVIEDFAHISPNCSVSGNINIGKFSHLGSGTSVHPGINIGDNVKTGVGSKIYKDILKNTKYKD